MFKLYNSARLAVEPVAGCETGNVTLYVCGPTVYDVPHLGHGRSALVYDILRRYLEWRGIRVNHVSNITDIDDKIINRAFENNISWEDLARKYERVWWDAVDCLGVLRPTSAPRATEFVGKMVDLIGKLIEANHAYVTPEGVWFDCNSIADYGLLAHQPLDSLRSGARVEIDESKKSPIDFALWKIAKQGEPSWPSPWGDGRPGWHTECVAMSLELLGDGFDIHAGGMDLQFPHHENERSQAVALDNRFALHWMHHAFIEVGGEKMAKSLGNFTSLDDLLSSSDPRAFRLLIMRSHYRSPIEVTKTEIADATDALARLDSLARRVVLLSEGHEVPETPQETLQAGQVGLDGPKLVEKLISLGIVADQSIVDTFVERMDDDLDTPRATAIIFDAIRQANTFADDSDQSKALALGLTVLELCASLGLYPSLAPTLIPAEVHQLSLERDQARLDKNFREADRLRDEITRLGWIAEDGPSGTVLRKA